MKNSRVSKKAQAEVREVFNMKYQVDESCISELNFKCFERDQEVTPFISSFSSKGMWSSM